MINRRVMLAVEDGLKEIGQPFKRHNTDTPDVKAGDHISYGILRGSGDVFYKAQCEGYDWYNIDNGYFKPGHFEGYYRISRGNTQAKFNPALATDDTRWKELGLEIKEWKDNEDGPIIICPPTPAVCQFFSIDQNLWIMRTVAKFKQNTNREVIVRHKDDPRPLDDMLDKAFCVYTFNSSVAWLALLNGVPAITDNFCVVKSWNNLTIDDVNSDLKRFDRKELFNFMANTQFTLQEFRERYDLWLPAIKSMSTWDGILGK